MLNDGQTAPEHGYKYDHLCYHLRHHTAIKVPIAVEGLYFSIVNMSPQKEIGRFGKHHVTNTTVVGQRGLPESSSVISNKIHIC